jgi:RNA polymerase sigma-70 factor (ECF subfamily)
MAQLAARTRMADDHTTAWLIGRLRAGDDGARAALLARVEPLLRRWAHGRLPPRLRDMQDTGDLVQTALLRALGRLDSFESAHQGALYGYLRTTLLNAMRDALRAQPADERVDADVLDTLPALPGSALDAARGRDGALAYEQVLQALEPAHREIVVMRFELGMSFPEIAAEIGESADGVRMKLNRAMRRMAALLADAGA